MILTSPSHLPFSILSLLINFPLFLIPFTRSTLVQTIQLLLFVTKRSCVRSPILCPCLCQNQIFICKNSQLSTAIETLTIIFSSAMPINTLPQNPNAIRTRFAIKFLEAMKRLNKGRVLPSPSMRDKYRRCRAVRAAACASMASAVGPDRAWSRAVLEKIKSRRLRRFHMVRSKRRRFGRRNPRKTQGFGQEQDLRGLVPGGRGMGLCSLLSETAHYINCLQTQVQVMTDILHRYST